MTTKKDKKPAKENTTISGQNKNSIKIKKENTDKEIEKQTYLRNQDDDYTYKDGYQESDSDKIKKIRSAVKPIQKKS
jgi:hypothetical protein